MCGVCGALGGEEHWSTASGRLQLDDAPTRRAERGRRIRIINEVVRGLQVRVSDWQGRYYLVAGPTGKQQVVDSLPHVWAALQEVARRSVDPLLAPASAAP
jgi:hypothetical protein